VLSRKRFFCASPGEGIYALFAWGDLDLADCGELMTVFQAAERFPTPRRQLVVLRRVRRIAASAMVAFLRHFESDSVYQKTIACEAVVRPDGVVGLLVEGFYPMVSPGYAGRAFTDLGAAVAWLGAQGPRGRAGMDLHLGPWLDEVTRLERERASGDDRLGPLRRLIAQRGADLSLREAAQGLGVSARSLQRTLAAAGTSFARERSTTCIGLARDLLMSTDEPVKAIASRLGYRSPARFVEAFRSETGVPPGRWRQVAGGRGSEDASG
jgi:AraC-like DNA-binding protein